MTDMGFRDLKLLIEAVELNENDQHTFHPGMGYKAAARRLLQARLFVRNMDGYLPTRRAEMVVAELITRMRGLAS